MKLLSTTLLLLFTCQLSAQNDAPCAGELHRQFSFWVGEWVVTDSLGKVQGENSISSAEGGCILNEHWKGASGSTGSSMNYYDASDSTWNQLWVVC